MNRATIEVIFNKQDGNTIQANDFFAQHDEAQSFELRRLLKELAINDGTPRYVCAECFQPLLICGGLKQKMHFEHYRDSADCELKTKGTFTHEQINRRKFNGAKESQLHLNIKEHLYTYLKNDPLCPDVNKEQVLQIKDVGGDRWWKKPDISAIFKDEEIVIEIQLSTTFLDVIVDREDFYQTRGSYILWVFDERELGQYRYSEKDIFYTHNRNAFIITEASKIKTKETGILHFECCYQVPSFDALGKHDEWVVKIVSIHDLTFDSQNYQLIFHNYHAHLKILEEQIELDSQKILSNAVSDFEHYWIEQRDHSLDNWNNEASDHEHLEPLLCSIDSYIELPLESHLSKVLTILFSIKSGKVVEYKMNMIGVLNMAMQSWPQYGVLFVQALGQYGLWKEVSSTESIKNKTDMIKKDWVGKQDGKYNEILALLFPEVIRKFNTHIEEHS